MKKVLGTVLAVVLLVASIFTFAACGEKKDDSKQSSNPIVASWKYDGSLDYTYTFKDDGTGSYNTMEFTYEIKDGNKISILYKGSTVPFETEYSINGDTLNVKDSLGRDTLYKKVK